MVESARVPTVFGLIIVLLLLLGLGTVVFVFLQSRGQTLRLGAAARALFGILWLVPAVAATVYVVGAAIPHFRDEALDVPSDAELLVHHVGRGRTIDIRSKPWPAPNEAVRDARQRALKFVNESLRPSYPYQLAWTPPESILERAIAAQSVERTEHKTETASFQMHVARLTLDLSPGVRRAYADAWLARIAEVRMVALAGLVALAIVIVTSAAAYFRLDLVTQGAYRRRLKLAAVSLIVAGGLALAQVLPDRSGPAPPATQPAESIAQTVGWLGQADREHMSRVDPATICQTRV